MTLVSAGPVFSGLQIRTMYDQEQAKYLKVEVSWKIWWLG
jgi:hypothetical protein